MKKIMLIFIVGSSCLFSKELIKPIPLNDSYDYNKAILGKKLFFDTRLSHNNTISCANCHLLDDGGDDNLPVSFGIDGKKGTRNSPTVLNARYNEVQFWDGGAENLADQVKGPINDHVEMGSNFKEIIGKLEKDKYYKKRFLFLYKEGITPFSITNAIAEFEKTLITPNSRFDKYLRGDKKALTKDELDGYNTFKDYGCISCHNGINIGGNLIQKFGVIQNVKIKDLGRYNVTKNEKDKFYFKVPSLRNVELTAPYFHNGSVKTLKEAVDFMIKDQIGFPLSQKEVKNIIKFLKTLTGEKVKIIKDNRDEKSN